MLSILHRSACKREGRELFICVFTHQKKAYLYTFICGSDYTHFYVYSKHYTALQTTHAKTKRVRRLPMALDCTHSWIIKRSQQADNLCKTERFFFVYVCTFFASFPLRLLSCTYDPTGTNIKPSFHPSKRDIYNRARPGFSRSQL